MKVKDLLRALGDIDDKYLIEKYEPIKKEEMPEIKNNVTKVNFRRREVIIIDKKILGIAAIVVLAILVIIANIINQNENGSSSLPKLIERANPIIEVSSAKEMKEYLGFDVPILDKEVESYVVIVEDKYATHGRIIYKDGTSFEMEKGSKDASGIYGGMQEKEEIINNVKVTFFSYENIKYANWIKDGYSYSYQNSNGEIDNEELEKIIK